MIKIICAMKSAPIQKIKLQMVKVRLPLDVLGKKRVSLVGIISVVSWCWWSSGAFQVINTFSVFFKVIVPVINIFLSHGQITEGLLLHFERFRDWNFIPQIKFNSTSLLNKFRHCKNRKNHFYKYKRRRPFWYFVF